MNPKTIFTAPPMHKANLSPRNLCEPEAQNHVSTTKRASSFDLTKHALHTVPVGNNAIPHPSYRITQ